MGRRMEVIGDFSPLTVWSSVLRSTDTAACSILTVTSGENLVTVTG